MSNLEVNLELSRIKLRQVEQQIEDLNFQYMELLIDAEGNMVLLNKIAGELDYLERQQNILVDKIRRKRQQINNLVN